MSKEHTLTDAIDYIKKLQSRVQELQQQLDESPGEVWEKQGIDSCSESFAAAEDTQHQVLVPSPRGFDSHT
jgi:cell division septum initiation protein DivIVA